MNGTYKFTGACWQCSRCNVVYGTQYDPFLHNYWGYWCAAGWSTSIPKTGAVMCVSAVSYTSSKTIPGVAFRGLNNEKKRNVLIVTCGIAIIIVTIIVIYQSFLRSDTRESVASKFLTELYTVSHDDYKRVLSLNAKAFSEGDLPDEYVDSLLEDFLKKYEVFFTELLRYKLLPYRTTAINTPLKYSYIITMTGSIEINTCQILKLVHP